MNNSEFAIYTHDFGLSNPMSLSSSIKQKMFVLYLGIDEYTSSKVKIIEALIFCRRQFIKKDSLESVLRPLIDDIKYLEKNGFSKVINGENVVLNVSIAYIRGVKLAARDKKFCGPANISSAKLKFN